MPCPCGSNICTCSLNCVCHPQSCRCQLCFNVRTSQLQSNGIQGPSGLIVQGILRPSVLQANRIQGPPGLQANGSLSTQNHGQNNSHIPASAASSNVDNPLMRKLLSQPPQPSNYPHTPLQRHYSEPAPPSNHRPHAPLGRQHSQPKPPSNDDPRATLRQCSQLEPPSNDDPRATLGQCSQLGPPSNDPRATLDGQYSQLEPPSNDDPRATVGQHSQPEPPSNNDPCSALKRQLSEPSQMPLLSDEVLTEIMSSTLNTNPSSTGGSDLSSATNNPSLPSISETGGSRDPSTSGLNKGFKSGNSTNSKSKNVPIFFDSSSSSDSIENIKKSAEKALESSFRTPSSDENDNRATALNTNPSTDVSDLSLATMGETGGSRDPSTSGLNKGFKSGNSTNSKSKTVPIFYDSSSSSDSIENIKKSAEKALESYLRTSSDDNDNRTTTTALNTNPYSTAGCDLSSATNNTSLPSVSEAGGSRDPSTGGLNEDFISDNSTNSKSKNIPTPFDSSDGIEYIKNLAEKAQPSFKSFDTCFKTPSNAENNNRNFGCIPSSQNKDTRRISTDLSGRTSEIHTPLYLETSDGSSVSACNNPESQSLHSSDRIPLLVSPQKHPLNLTSSADDMHEISLTHSPELRSRSPPPPPAKIQKMDTMDTNIPACEDNNNRRGAPITEGLSGRLLERLKIEFDNSTDQASHPKTRSESTASTSGTPVYASCIVQNRSQRTVITEQHEPPVVTETVSNDLDQNVTNYHLSIPSTSGQSSSTSREQTSTHRDSVITYIPSQPTNTFSTSQSTNPVNTPYPAQSHQASSSAFPVSSAPPTTESMESSARSREHLPHHSQSSTLQSGSSGIRPSQITTRDDDYETDENKYKNRNKRKLS